MVGHLLLPTRPRLTIEQTSCFDDSHPFGKTAATSRRRRLSFDGDWVTELTRHSSLARDKLPLVRTEHGFSLRDDASFCVRLMISIFWGGLALADILSWCMYKGSGWGMDRWWNAGLVFVSQWQYRKSCYEFYPDWIFPVKVLIIRTRWKLTVSNFVLK